MEYGFFWAKASRLPRKDSALHNEAESETKIGKRRVDASIIPFLEMVGVLHIVF